MSARLDDFQARLLDFVADHIYPNEPCFFIEGERFGFWSVLSVVAELKVKARAAGLWNLFLQAHYEEAGQMSNSSARCRLDSRQRSTTITIGD